MAETLSRQHSGMRGVYLVAAELSRLGFSVSPTSRNAAHADLLVFDPDTARATSIDVKTNSRRANFWLMGKNSMSCWSPTHFYVFLNIVPARKEHAETYEYYLVPSRVAARKTTVQRSKTGSVWYSVSVESAARFRDAWSQLHSPGK